MMFQMATGKLPFPGLSFGEVLVGHLQLPPPRPRDIVPATPEAYEALVLKCLEKKQESRYQSMHALHDAIAQVMEQLGISRELPAASPEEIKAASGPRTKSIPELVSKTPARALRSSIQRRTPATPGRPQMTVATPPPPPPQKPRIGLWVGVGAGAIAVVGGIVLFVLQQSSENRRAAEQAAHLAAQRFADQARQAQRAEEEQKRQESERVQLSVVSDPMGAVVEATWNGGVKAAVTPFDLAVPKNASVRFAFTKKEFLSHTIEILADTPKVVRASLLAEPKAPPVVKAKSERSEKKSKQASSESDESSIPVEF
jgi:alkanesulfonate monooxygenase SsuD/methylene tetrahydromethanopterin reductase-like flavin-dependent oxidoreductase (luciferase family)